jgi:GTP-binding protein
LLEQRKAIVEDTRCYPRPAVWHCRLEWQIFYVIDTGGFVPEAKTVFEREIRKQVRIAMDEASVILFVVDAATGMTDLDDAMADVCGALPNLCCWW